MKECHLGDVRSHRQVDSQRRQLGLAPDRSRQQQTICIDPSRCGVNSHHLFALNSDRADFAILDDVDPHLESGQHQRMRCWHRVDIKGTRLVEINSVSGRTEARLATRRLLGIDGVHDTASLTRDGGSPLDILPLLSLPDQQVAHPLHVKRNPGLGRKLAEKGLSGQLCRRDRGVLDGSPNHPGGAPRLSRPNRMAFQHHHFFNPTLLQADRGVQRGHAASHDDHVCRLNHLYLTSWPPLRSPFSVISLDAQVHSSQRILWLMQTVSGVA